MSADNQPVLPCLPNGNIDGAARRRRFGARGRRRRRPPSSTPTRPPCSSLISFPAPPVRTHAQRAPVRLPPFFPALRPPSVDPFPAPSWAALPEKTDQCVSGEAVLRSSNVRPVPCLDFSTYRTAFRAVYIYIENVSPAVGTL